MELGEGSSVGESMGRDIFVGVGVSNRLVPGVLVMSEVKL